MYKVIITKYNVKNKIKGVICMLMKFLLKVVLMLVIFNAVFAGEITVSAAASLKDVMGEIEKNYEAEFKGTKVVFNFGASGSLQQQIENGAPVDIFISAGLKQIEELNKKGYLLAESQNNLLKNDIVLVIPRDSKVNLKDFYGLNDEKIKIIGIGEPKSVPVGQYSWEVFKKLNILNGIESKLIYGKDVRTVLTWVETENVDAGIVYKTDAILSDKIKIIGSAPKDSHSPVIYPVAIIKDTKYISEAKKFLEFLKGKKAKEIFIKYGFTPIN